MPVPRLEPPSSFSRLILAHSFASFSAVANGVDDDNSDAFVGPLVTVDGKFGTSDFSVVEGVEGAEMAACLVGMSGFARFLAVHSFAN